MQRPKLSAEQMAHLKSEKAWVQPTLLLGIYGSFMAMVYGLRYMQESGFPLWSMIAAGLLAALITAGLQSHILILLHEGAHGHLAKNKTLNEFLGNVLCAYPFFMFARVYKYFHLDHHRYGGTEKDPEISAYRNLKISYEGHSMKEIAVIFIRGLSGIVSQKLTISMYKYYFEKKKNQGAQSLGFYELAGMPLFWAAVIAGGLHFGILAEILLIWFGASFLSGFFLMLHGIGEHNGVLGGAEWDRTYNHDFSFLANFFIYPIKSGFHIEHHLFPTIPWYNVEKLRAILAENKAYSSSIETNTLDGYFFGKKTVFHTQLKK